MNNAEYVMLSKETALFRSLDHIANNIANVNTVGFQKDKLLFKEYITKVEHNNKLYYPLDHDTFRDTQNGTLKLTNKVFDVAIQGDGYFVIDTPDGLRYTRAGNFTINENSVLVTQQGFPVSTIDGGQISFQPGDENIVIQRDGTVMANGENRGLIGIATFDNPQLMQKIGNNLLTTDQSAASADLTETKIAQGYIEESNVNSITEITEMIKTTRLASGTSLFLNGMDDMTKNALRKISSN